MSKKNKQTIFSMKKIEFLVKWKLHSKICVQFTSSQALCDALEEKNNQDCIRKFLSDPQVPALYVQRSSTKGKCEKTIDWFF